MPGKESEMNTELLKEFTTVELSREPVELYKILKFENLVVSGGEAKLVIADGLVRVNGKTETQKRKKLVSGDSIEFGDIKLMLTLSGKAGEDATSLPKKSQPSHRNAASRKPIAMLKGE